MRVTTRMMTNNMMRWLSKQTEKLSDAETVVASGKQINRPSDDPEAAGQILEDRATISKYGQYQSNIDLAVSWIEASEEILEAVDSLLDEALDIAFEQTSGDLDTVESSLETLQGIYDQIVALANTKFGSNYMYSGNQTDTMPFSDEVSISDGTPEDIVFGLVSDASNVSIEITDSSGQVVRTVTVSGGTEGDNTVTWDGLDDSGDPLPDGDYSFSVSATDTSGQAVGAYTAYRGDDGTRQVIFGENSVVALNADGGVMFEEIFSAMSQLRTAMEESTCDDDLASQVQDSLKDSIEQIATERVALSNVYTQLGTADDRLDQLTLVVNSRMSDAENGSDEEAVVKLQAQQTVYEVALEAVSKILKLPKLSDYL